MQRYSGVFIASLRKATASTLAVMTALVMVAGAFHPTVVRAAAGEGTATVAVGTGTLTNAFTATYGSDLSTVAVTVGTLTYIKIKLTVGASHIAAAQNNVTMRVPTNLFPSNGFDTNEEAVISDVNAAGEYFITYTDVSMVTNNTSISFAASASVNTGLITIQADQQMDATDILMVYVAVNDLNNFISAQAVSIQTDDTGANNLTGIAANPTVSTAAANAGASIVVASPTVGATGNVTLTLTTPFALDAADTIDITFPAYMNVAGVGSAVTGTFESSDSITCAVASQVVTCTTTAATNATGTIIMTGITSYYVGTTDVSVLEVENEGNATNDIADDTTTALTDIVAADAAASVTLGTNNYVGAVGNTTLTVTLPVNLDADDTIEFTFPASMNVAGVAFSSETFAGAGTLSGCAAASQLVTCTASGAITAGTGTIVMSGIKAAFAATTDMTSLEVEDEGVGANDIATDSVIAMTDTLSSDSESEDDSSSSSADTYDIEVTVPEASEAYIPGDSVDITWDTSGGSASPGFVSLYYSVDGGTTLETIVENTVNDSSYTWTVPDITEQSVVIVAYGTDLLEILATDESGAFSVNVEEGAEVEEEEDAEDVDTSEDSEELLPDGTYMRGESWSTVYYVEDGSRHPFLDSQTFFTYADDFDDVIEVEDGYLSNYIIGTPMLPKAGTVLVKVQSVNSVYVLEAGNTLRWITSEDLAEELFGDDWADYVIDVPVTAWAHFNHGDDVESASEVSVDIDSMQTRDELNSK